MNFSETRTFQEVWENPFPIEEVTGYDYFKKFYEECGVPDRLKATGKYTLQTIYFLLMSEFANNHYLSYDENRFKLQVMSTIMQYGPQWQKLMEAQDKLIALTDNELEMGTTAIHNHAMHPDTAPTTQTLTELQYIDDQNVSKYTRDKLEGQMRLIDALDDTATKRFINMFRPLFNIVVFGDKPLIITEEDDLI